MNKNILLAGAGDMAVEYAKILKAMNIGFSVVGRSVQSAKSFEDKTGVTVHTGGVDSWIAKNSEAIDTAIVAVGEKWLGDVSTKLINSGFKRLLVEKPGAFTGEELKQLYSLSKKQNTEVFIGYNRRYYSSVETAKKIISKDGGVVSFVFEFTEWAHKIKDIIKEAGVKENWFFHNSTHVVDLAFYLGGRPKEITCYKAGTLDWHKQGSVFVGSGISDCGALFSYHANWSSPGRWSIEILTQCHRLIFKPLEALQIQKIGSVSIEPYAVEDAYDKEFKPGLYKEVELFLSGDSKELCTIGEQVKNSEVYQKICPI